MSRNKTYTALFAASFSSLSFTAAYASEMESMVVTATRTPIPITKALASVTSITRADIERLQVTSVPELLARVPGINISKTGGEGSVTGIFIRGANSNQTLILIDGIRSSSATLGSTAIQHLSPDQIERIEVVRGPRASLYGPDAIGGVVQIFTKQGSKKLQTSLTVGGGSNETQKVAASASGGDDDTQANISADYYETQGFSHKDTDTPPDNDDDAYRNSSVSANISHQINKSNLLKFSATHSEGESESDGGSPVYNEFALSSVTAYLQSALTSNWDSSIQLGYFIDESNNRSDEPNYPYDSDTETTRQSISWQNDLKITDSQLLTIGADYYKEEVDSTTNYAEDTADDLGIFSQLQAGFNRWDLTIGLRVDDHDGFGSHSTGNIASGFQLNDQYRLIASYGTAFKAPTLNDLYYIDPYSQGNPDLKPEESETAELELRADNSYFNFWSISIYQTTVNDLIVWESDPITWASVPKNISDVDISGSDIAISHTISDWSFNFAYTYLDTEDGESHRPLARRAEHTANLDIDYLFGEFTIGTTLYGQSKRYDYDFSGNQYRLDGYGTVALRASYQLSDSLQLKFKVTNLFNKDYTLANTYHTDGTNAFLSITYVP